MTGRLDICVEVEDVLLDETDAVVKVTDGELTTVLLLILLAVLEVLTPVVMLVLLLNSMLEVEEVEEDVAFTAPVTVLEDMP